MLGKASRVIGTAIVDEEDLSFGAVESAREFLKRDWKGPRLVEHWYDHAEMCPHSAQSM